VFDQFWLNDSDWAVLSASTGLATNTELNNIVNIKVAENIQEYCLFMLYSS